MVGSGGQTRKHLLSRTHHVLALAGAALLASGLVQLGAQTMGPWLGPVPEVDSDFAAELAKDPTVVFVPVFTLEATPQQQRTGSGKSTDSGHYAPNTDAVEFTGVCKDEAECKQHSGKAYVEVAGKVSTEALGVSPDNPITEVIPAVIIKVGNGSCHWVCTSPGNCDCMCFPPQIPPRCPKPH